MSLESIVVSLPLSRRLHELGVRVESVFYWTGKSNEKPHLSYGVDARYSLRIPAYLSGELGEMLKGAESLMLDLGGTTIEWNPVWKYWQCFLYDQNNEVSHEEHDPKESDARAKMLIYLFESGHLKVEDINGRAG
jgi:hypothetical protein